MKFNPSDFWGVRKQTTPHDIEQVKQLFERHGKVPTEKEINTFGLLPSEMIIYLDNFVYSKDGSTYYAYKLENPDIWYEYTNSAKGWRRIE